MKEPGQRSDSSDIVSENDQSLDELEDEEEEAAFEEKHTSRIADGAGKKAFCPSKQQGLTFQLATRG